MIEFFHSRISEIESSVASGIIHSRDECLKRLRSLGLVNFGELMFSLPSSDFPLLSSLLPSMASAETQQAWTGAHGISLLQQSLDFVQLNSARYSQFTGKSLNDALILDFGCGYGRLLRLFYYFTSEFNLFGVDPLQASLDECARHGMTTNLYLSDFLPSELPFPYKIFDFIFSFSVFTHLNEEAALRCLQTLGNYLAPQGVLVITIRPCEFWLAPSHVAAHLEAENINPQELINQHRRGEFVFVKGPGLDHYTYGDASFDLSWIERNVINLRIAYVDHSISDPMQLYVGLAKV